MRDKFLRYILKNSLVENGDKLVLGVSGGADSVCLLHLFAGLADELSLDLTVLHINHGLRGEESEGDEVFVREFSEKLGVKFISRQGQLRNNRAQEEEARDIRYNIFNKVCAELGIKKCVLAHNSDDNVETILMWIIRGAGINGVSGIPERRFLDYDKKIEIIRPLLKFSRADIEAYVREHKVEFRVDSSNKTAVYFRNKIRLELLPLLESEYNKNVREHILNMAKGVSDVRDFAEDEIKKYCNDLYYTKHGNIVIDLNKYMVYNTLIRKNILAFILKGKSYFKHLEKINDLLEENTGNFSLDLPGNLCVKKVYDELIIVSMKEENGSPEPAALRMTDREGSELEVQFKIDEIIRFGDYKFKSKLCVNQNLDLKNKNFGFFDYDLIKNKKLFFRYFQDGDRFFPYGMRGVKKLQDFFSDLKIPKEKRRGIPLLVARDTGDEIIWVAGYRINAKYKVSDKTVEVLMVEMKNCHPQL